MSKALRWFGYLVAALLLLLLLAVAWIWSASAWLSAGVMRAAPRSWQRRLLPSSPTHRASFGSMPIWLSERTVPLRQPIAIPRA